MLGKGDLRIVDRFARATGCPTTLRMKCVRVGRRR
jgi:hypothetical protein